MSYKDGIRIGSKHSFEDFGLVLNNREIGYPEKISIRKTVPYMNGFYDYTKLYGAPAWGPREITYTFDVIGFTVEEMEAERVPVVNWLCNVHDEDIFDDAFPDYHFRGSFDSISSSEDGEQATLAFTFVCHPFMIKNVPDSHALIEDGALSIVNNGQPTMLKVATTGGVTVSMGGTDYGVPVGVYDVLTLENGVNNLDVKFKNELPYPYMSTTRTENGVTFTVNADGSITVNGKATAETLYYLTGTSFVVESGNHYLSGIPDGYEQSMWLQVGVHDEAGTDRYYYKNHNTKDVAFSVVDTTQYCVVYIRVLSGATIGNVTVKPFMNGEAVLEFAEEVL